MHETDESMKEFFLATRKKEYRARPKLVYFQHWCMLDATESWRFAFSNPQLNSYRKLSRFLSAEYCVPLCQWTKTVWTSRQTSHAKAASWIVTDSWMMPLKYSFIALPKVDRTCGRASESFLATPSGITSILLRALSTRLHAKYTDRMGRMHNGGP